MSSHQWTGKSNPAPVDICESGKHIMAPAYFIFPASKMGGWVGEYFQAALISLTATPAGFQSHIFIFQIF